MIPKQPTQKKQWIGRTCQECQNGTWDTKHVNQRTPENGGGSFVKKCPFSTWANNKQGETICLANTRACEKFIDRQWKNKTIEARAKAIAEKWKLDIIRGGEDLSFTHLEYVAKQAATEQDRIARQEERERCIKVITEMLDDPYEYYSVDGYTHNQYVDEDKIREAIEE